MRKSKRPDAKSTEADGNLQDAFVFDRREIPPAEVPMPFAIIPTDASAIRKEWLKRYHETERKLGKLKAEWRRYEEEAHPGFQKWYHQVFFEEISELSQLGERIREKQSFFTAMEVNKRVYRISDKQAYRHVMQAIAENRDPFPDPEDLENCRKQEQAEREAETEKRKAAREAWRAQFAEHEFDQDDDEENEEEVDEESEDEDEEGSEEAGDERDDSRGRSERSNRGRRDASANNQAQTSQSRQSTLKNLYRKVVRALHPDTGKSMSPSEKILWQQAQTAYKTQNLEMMKMISLKLQGDGHIIVSQVEQVGELMNLVQTLQKELKSLQSLKERNKQDALYQFWVSEKQPKVRNQLKTEITLDLGRQVYRLKSYLREAEQELQSLARKYR